MSLPVLSLRQLNRALLARQHLLVRASFPLESRVERLVERLAGLNAQDPQQPYISLWSRLAGFRREELDRALEERLVVKAMLIRSTLHMVSRRDYLRVRPVVQPVLDRVFRANFKGASERLPMAALAEAARAFATAEPRSLPEIREHLRNLAPEEEPAALLFLARTQVEMLQLPPRGGWGSHGTPAWLTAEGWLGRPVSPEAAPGRRRLVLRYLRAFGPAAEADLTAWAGLSLTEGVAELERWLVRYRDEEGRVLLDLRGMELPAPETPAPVRFLPAWDNLLLSHKERGRVLPERYRSRVILSGGRVQPTFLLDGMVAGLWRWERSGRAAQLRLEPFEPLPPAQEEALRAEGLALLRFLAEGAERYEVAVQPVG